MVQFVKDSAVATAVVHNVAVARVWSLADFHMPWAIQKKKKKKEEETVVYAEFETVTEVEI